MRIVCLANSRKYQNRCLAGIEVSNNNEPIMKNGRPKWIRPVCNTERGEVPTELVKNIKLLDIIELEQIGPAVRRNQPENIYFKTDSLKVVDKYNKKLIPDIIDNERFSNIFGDTKDFISQYVKLDYSLTLISTSVFSPYLKDRSEYGNAPQLRFRFIYNGDSYDLAVTDLEFEKKYETDANILKRVDQVYLVISLGGEYKGRNYKLIAGVIF